MDKIVSLRRNNEFRRAYARGKSYVGSALVTYVLKNRAGCVRVGITTSKKVGNAVQRNRSRRVIRAAYRSLAERVLPGYDLVLVARGRTCHCKSTEVARQLASQLSSAGVLRERKEGEKR